MGEGYSVWMWWRDGLSQRVASTADQVVQERRAWPLVSDEHLFGELLKEEGGSALVAESPSSLQLMGIFLAAGDDEGSRIVALDRMSHQSRSFFKGDVLPDEGRIESILADQVIWVDLNGTRHTWTLSPMGKANAR